MEPKKSAPPVAAAPPRQKIVDFVGEVKLELGRITWTSPEELKLYIKAVIGATFVFGLGLYVVDLGIQGVLNGFGVLIRLIFG